MRNKRNPDGKAIARTLSDADLEEMLKKIGSLTKEKRSAMGTLEDISYEVRVSRSALARHEKGGDMNLSNFLKVLYGLYIEPEDFFKALKKPAPKKK